jgi:hypothetical protein
MLLFHHTVTKYGNWFFFTRSDDQKIKIKKNRAKKKYAPFRQ